jgi:hypothetical protein
VVKKSIIAVSIAIASLAPFTQSVSAANDPLPPAEWRMPQGTRYIGYNKINQQCWKYWKIVKCR